MIQGPRRVLFFDGNCVTCNRALNFISARLSRETELSFVPIDSPLAIILLGEHQKVSERDALIYWDEDSLLQGAAAVERVLSLMPRWRVLGSLLALLPERFTEASYDLFASNRYRWNERLTECKIPDPQMAERLLGQ